VSKSVLIGALVGCVLAVGLIAVLTATVITDDNEGGRILRVDGSFPESGPGMPMPGPGRGQRFPMPGQGQKLPGLERMKVCLQRQGAARGAVKPRALRVCMAVPSLR
jgi:hypothetical protein